MSGIYYLQVLGMVESSGKKLKMERTELHESQYASSLIEASLDPLIAFNTKAKSLT